MIYLVISVFLFSLNNILWSYFSKDNPAILLIARRAIFTSLLFTIIILIFKSEFHVITSSIVKEILLICFFGFLGLAFLIRGFSLGNLFQYSMFSLLIPIVFAFLKPSEERSIELWIPLLITTVGFSYFVWKQFKESLPKTTSNRANTYFFLAHLFFGIAMYLQFEYFLIENRSSVMVAAFQEVFILIIASLIVFFNKKSIANKVRQPLKIKHYFIMSLPISLAIIIGLEGLRHTAPFDASLIGLYTPMTTVLLGSFLGIDKIDFQSFIGVVIMTFGVLLIYF